MKDVIEKLKDAWREAEKQGVSLESVCFEVHKTHGGKLVLLEVNITGTSRGCEGE